MTIADHPGPLVSIYVCHDPSELPVVESLLTEAGIRYLVRGAYTQGLLGGGQFGGTNLVAGPLDVQVLQADEAEAVALLEATTNLPDDEPGV